MPSPCPAHTPSPTDRQPTPTAAPAHHGPTANGPRQSHPTTSVLTIGSFDGVHLGHAALIAMARSLALRGSSAAALPRVVALVFDPHPLTLLDPAASPPPRLSTFDQRRAHLLQLGADEVVRLEPTPALLGTAPDAFIQSLVAAWSPVAIVEGEDFRFGKGRAGDTALLAALGARLNFDSVIVPAVDVTLDDHTLVKASSTMARWLVTHGRIRDAAAVLGRRYSLAGMVERGDRRGRAIGFPTANLRPLTMLPAQGVYAALARLPSGRLMPAAVNIGPRPTFTDATAIAAPVEAHIILPRSSPTDHAWAPLDGLSEYGWHLELELLAYLRDTVRFAGADALRAQLHRDAARAAQLAAACDGHAYSARAQHDDAGNSGGAQS